jgi:ABC-type polysaccharide/polyol phosphate transport system ATPase subunit
MFMNDVAIRVEDLGKKYHIGGKEKSYTRIGDKAIDMISSPFRRMKRLLTGQSMSAADLDQIFWALNKVSFEIKQGEIVGVIGHNGAGKSTLLKILSRITEPTTGYADVFGRVGSLLEVGTGFHPELTGRENVFLNGSILGMRKAEINRKFDEIVDFAEIEQFIDTPVKHYSSGMYVRLAFSVAAHLDPEILLIDEVLAVGDVAFQKKSLGKMEDVSQQGRTVIFVSHNMNALQRLCPNSILLNHGRLIIQASTNEVVEQYLSTSSTTSTKPNAPIDLRNQKRDGTKKVQFESLVYTADNSSLAFHPYTNGPLIVSVDLFAESDCSVGSIAVIIFDRYGTKLVNADTMSLGWSLDLTKGINTIRFQLDQLHLNPGLYTIGLWAADPPVEVYDYLKSAAMFEVVETEDNKIRVHSDGIVSVNFQITRSEIKSINA